MRVWSVSLSSLCLVAGVVLAALYALAAYWSADRSTVFILFAALLPLAWGALALARSALRPGVRPSARAWRLAPALLLLAGLPLAWQSLMDNVRLLYLLQHAGMHAALAWVFGRTLAPGRTPLCTEMASWVHEDINAPALRRYTRSVTVVWTAFFVLITALSLALYLWATARVWAIFSTAISPLLTGLLFIAENMARHWRLPPQDRVGFSGTWRAVRARLAARAQQAP